MSFHRFRTEHRGCTVGVTLGYDRVTRDYFLNTVPLNAEGRIEFPDDEEDEESDEDNGEADDDAGGPLFLALDNLDLDTLRQTLDSLGLRVPETMFAALENDRRHNVGSNRVVNYAADGSDDQGPPWLLLGEYEGPVGTTQAFRFIAPNGALVIELRYQGQEQTDTLSIVLADATHYLGPGEFFVQNWGDNEILIAPALASGLFEDTGRLSPSFGMTQLRAPIWKIRQPAASTSEGSSST